MACHFPERFAAGWCRYRGYVVRGYAWIAKRAKCRYTCERDIVAFDALNAHPVPIESPMHARSAGQT